MKRFVKVWGLLLVAIFISVLLVLIGNKYHLHTTILAAPTKSIANGAGTKPVPLIKSENDKRQYEYFVLKNSLRVLLVSDPHADKAAAALDVNVGSGNDPKTRQGLAHFLEHMLFLGTKKYPKSGEYQDYISAHGGVHNASTGLENTTYYFDIEPKFLPEGLDRFSQFFIAPLFNREFVEREKHAVDSEYQAKINDDGRHLWDVLRELFSSKNPAATFGVGSLATLSDNERSKVRDDLLAFYPQYYSANIMALAVIGRNSLPELRAMVEKNFSAIPNRDVKIEQKEQPVFRDGLLPSKLLVQSVRNERHLMLIFPLPSMLEHYRIKPDAYIAWLLGHEGEGSLFAELKKRGWAERLSAGAGLSGRFASAFQVDISLTEKGYAHIDDIVMLFFQAVAALKKNGVAGWQYEEQQRTRDFAFRFSEKQDPADYAGDLAGAMQTYAPDDILRGDFLMARFDGRLITDVANRLKPSNMLMIVTEPNIDSQKNVPIQSERLALHAAAKKTNVSDSQESNDLFSQYYKTRYRIEKINPKMLSQWKNAQTFSGIYMPGKNLFIPEQLKLKEAPVLAATFKNIPHKIDSGKNYTLWFLQDQEHQVPKANIMVYARSPYASASVRDAAMAELFVRLLNDHLNAILYTAGLGGLNFSIEKRSRGISFQLSGYSDKQGLLLKSVLQTFKNPVFTEARFQLIKEQWQKELINESKQSPYQQLARDLPVVLVSGYWGRQDYLKALATIKLKDVQAYDLSYMQTITADVLIYGNVYEAEALKLGQIIENTLNLTSQRQPDNPARVVQLPSAAAPYLYVDNLEHNDSALIKYFQAANDTVEQQVQAALLAQMTKSAFFQALRTEQQLGYVVAAAYTPLLQMPGLMFLVQSPAHSVGEINERINTFIADYYLFLNKQGDAWFEGQRRALLTQLQEKPQSQSDQAQEYWNDMILGYVNFDHREQQIGALKKITRQQALDFYRNNLLDKNRRQLLLVSPGKAGTKALLEDGKVKYTDLNNVDALKLFKASPLLLHAN